MRTWIGIVLLLVAGTARADFRMMASPGPLAQAHQALDRQCDKCHRPFQGTPASSCLSCHARTAEQLRTGTGFHAASKEKKCTACHGDHKGRGFALSPPLDERRFDHAITGYPLTGRHRAAACGKCHQAKGGVTRWVGAPTACVACHADTHHKGALGKDCAPCHGTQTFRPPPRHDLFEHKLAMNGGHSGKNCAACHKGGAHFGAAWSCGDCHEQKHGGTKAPCATCHNVHGWQEATFKHDFCTCILPGKHQTAPCLSCHPAFRFQPTPFECAECHRKDRKHEDLGACSRCHSAMSWKQRAFDHNRKSVGFPITGEHLNIGCENCHKQPGVFRGAPRACEGCHAVPRHGDFGPCEKCHTTAGFLSHRFSHNKTRFPLKGAHKDVACETCHARFKKGEFVPGPNACVLCHGDPHKGQFQGEKKLGALRPTAPLLLAAAGAGVPAVPAAHDVSDRWGCLDCHSPERFRPSTIDVRGHDRFAFPLRQAHEKVACARCHLDGRFVGTAQRCAACHVDPHAGQLGAGCQDCHGGAAFAPSLVTAAKHAGFPFPLKGAHEKAACRGCHKDDLFVATAQRCASCHQDVHRGKLGAECQGCHRETRFRDTPPFDHARRTGFALDNGHARLACDRCHGADHRRYLKLREVTCETCHPPRHGRQFGTDCQGCHLGTRFSDLKPFDHGARTGFALERRHGSVACLTCHDVKKGQRQSGMCQTCHGDPHRGGLGTECGDCHRTDRWTLVRFDHDRSEFPLRGRHFVAPCLWCHRNNQWVGLRTECVACHARDRPNNARHMARGLECGNAGCHTPFTWSL